jgi:hypothetical protein
MNMSLRLTALCSSLNSTSLKKYFLSFIVFYSFYSTVFCTHSPQNLTYIFNYSLFYIIIYPTIN